MPYKRSSQLSYEPKQKAIVSYTISALFYLFYMHTEKDTHHHDLDKQFLEIVKKILDLPEGLPKRPDIYRSEIVKTLTKTLKKRYWKELYDYSPHIESLKRRDERFLFMQQTDREILPLLVEEHQWPIVESIIEKYNLPNLLPDEKQTLRSLWVIGEANSISVAYLQRRIDALHALFIEFRRILNTEYFESRVKNFSTLILHVADLIVEAQRSIDAFENETKNGPVHAMFSLHKKKAEDTISYIILKLKELTKL